MKDKTIFRGGKPEGQIFEKRIISFYEWSEGFCNLSLDPIEFFKNGPGEIRTPDLVVKSHLLYQTELRAQTTEEYY